MRTLMAVDGAALAARRRVEEIDERGGRNALYALLVTLIKEEREAVLDVVTDHCDIPDDRFERIRASLGLDSGTT